MLPHQKYPSGQRGHPYDQSYPPSTAIPQSPFDAVYGSSLLPRQLLVSSPFVQVPSPLPSPHHHGHPHRSYSYNGVNGYYVGAPAPVLSLPPKRNSRFDQTPSKRNPKSPNLNNVTTRGIDYTDLSETSSQDDSSSLLEFNKDAANPSVDNDQLKSDSSTSLSQIYLTNNSSISSNISQSSANIQISKVPSRAIMMTNVNPLLTITKLLDLVHFGPLENVRVIENTSKGGTNSIVLTFLKAETCLNFFNNLLTYFSKFQHLIDSPNLSINFISMKKPLPFISYAAINDGATRNVFIGQLNNLPQDVDDEFLKKELSKFGVIDKIDIIQRTIKGLNDDQDHNADESIEKSAFIHFASIASAIKTVDQLSLNPFWQDTKIFYGTDRCSVQNDHRSGSIIDEEDEKDDDNASISKDYTTSYFDKEQSVQSADNLASVHYIYPTQSPYIVSSHTAYMPYQSHVPLRRSSFVDESLNHTHGASMPLILEHGNDGNAGNRTISISNFDFETKVEDLCNIIRGGNLQNIKLLREKRRCFVTFIESTAATRFFTNSQISPLTLHGQRLNVGWGENRGSLPLKISLAMTVGASRNVYIGIEDKDENGSQILPSEQELREDFSKFGEIEQINYFKNNSCVFLNFLNIRHAIKIVTDANGTASDDFHKFFQNKYKSFKISYGKDRCGNPPKANKGKRSKKKKKNKTETNTDEVKGELEQNQPTQTVFNSGKSYSTKEESLDEVENTEIDPRSKHTVEEVPAELFKSLGIGQKDDFLQTPSKQILGDGKIGAFGITNNYTASIDGESSSSALDSEDDSSSIEILVDGTSENQSTTGSDRIAFEKPRYNKFTSTSSSTSELPGFNGQRRGSYQRRYHSNAPSRISSRASLNSNYEPSFDFYKPPPFAPQLSRENSRSNISTMFPPPIHIAQQQHQNSYNISGNTYSKGMTSGLQVMTQYLEQSQHDNLIYAANVLHAVNNPSHSYEYGNENQRSQGRQNRRRF